ncbi:MAG: mannonate dehydratase [Caldilineaceae bacterium]
MTGYDQYLMKNAPHRVRRSGRRQTLGKPGILPQAAIVLVAEEAGVQLAMHPDDPPLSPIRGLGRIMRSVDNYQRLLDLYPSPMNGITLCQGNFTLMTDDLPAPSATLANRTRSSSSTSAMCGDARTLQRNVPRRRQNQHARMHESLPRYRLRRRPAP